MRIIILLWPLAAALLMICSTPNCRAASGEPLPTGQLSLSGSLGFSLPLRRNLETGIGAAAGAAIDVGIGQNLQLGLGASYSSFKDSHYLLAFPLTLTACFDLTDDIQVMTVGGLGPAFSNLPQWENTDITLSACLGGGVHLLQHKSLSVRLTALYLTAGTSTCNVDFFLCSLSFRIRL